MTKRFFAIAVILSSIFAVAFTAVAAKNEMLQKARESAAHEEWEQAAALAQQAVDQDPKNEAAWSFLGDAQAATGDTATAVLDWEKAISLNPKYPDAVLALTGIYLQQNRSADAERIVSGAEAKDPKGKIDEIKVARGMIFAGQNNMAEATRILASAAAKNPKNPLYPQILARIYENKQVHDLAEKYYADAWALAPGNPTLAYEYGLVLQQQKKYDEALDLFKMVQAKDPNNKSVDYMIGRLYYAAKRWAEAAAQFEKSVEKRPDHFPSFFLLGRCYYEFSKEEKKNFYGQAEGALRRASELRPERQDVNALLAEILVTQGKLYYQRAQIDTANGNARALLDSCLMATRSGLSVDSAAVGANGQLARAWFKIGNMDSSVFYSEKQLAITPDDQTEFARLISAKQRKKDQAGLILSLKPIFDKQDWTKPKAESDTVATPQDKFIDKYGGVYANAFIETNKSSDAREALKAMLTYRPSWSDGHSMNAYIELRRENYEGAVPILQQGVRACPKDKDLWNSLGDAIYFSDPKKKDNVNRAKEAYERACALGSREACDKLKQLGA